MRLPRKIAQASKFVYNDVFGVPSASMLVLLLVATTCFLWASATPSSSQALWAVITRFLLLVFFLTMTIRQIIVLHEASPNARATQALRQKLTSILDNKDRITLYFQGQVFEISWMASCWSVMEVRSEDLTSLVNHPEGTTFCTVLRWKVPTDFRYATYVQSFGDLELDIADLESSANPVHFHEMSTTGKADDLAAKRMKAPSVPTSEILELCRHLEYATPQINF